MAAMGTLCRQPTTCVPPAACWTARPPQQEQPLPPSSTALLQPRDCSYDMAELRERVLQLLEQEEAAQAAA
jgi:hypothetical protein